METVGVCSQLGHADVKDEQTAEFWWCGCHFMPYLPPFMLFFSLQIAIDDLFTALE